MTEKGGILTQPYQNFSSFGVSMDLAAFGLTRSVRSTQDEKTLEESEV